MQRSLARKGPAAAGGKGPDKGGVFQVSLTPVEAVGRSLFEKMLQRTAIEQSWIARSGLQETRRIGIGRLARASRAQIAQIEGQPGGWRWSRL